MSANSPIILFHAFVYYAFLNVGDAGFPLQPFLLVPVQIPDNLEEEAYNKGHRKIRKLNEICLGYLKGRFKYAKKFTKFQTFFKNFVL